MNPSAVARQAAANDMRRKRQAGVVFFPTASTIQPFVTDVNELPYPRFYRGRALAPYPIVWEREAGYNADIRKPGPFVQEQPPPDAANLFCFQPACSTIFPCDPARSHTRLPTDSVSISP